jgi:hypothetical protein
VGGQPKTAIVASIVFEGKVDEFRTEKKKESGRGYDDYLSEVERMLIKYVLLGHDVVEEPAEVVTLEPLPRLDPRSQIADFFAPQMRAGHVQKANVFIHPDLMGVERGEREKLNKEPTGQM